MTRTPSHLCLAILVQVLLLAGAIDAADDSPAALSAVDTAFFEKKIRPVLVKHCYACHSTRAAKSKKLRGGLNLDSRSGVRSGGDSGPALVAGKPDQSLLLESLQYKSLEMPPKGRLPAAIIADFGEWIRRGAPDPRRGRTTTRKAIDIKSGRQFWSYQPLPKMRVPPAGPSRATSAIDAFLLARLDEAGIDQAVEAPRAVLARRLYFDLLGLPPTPDQLDTFLQDHRQDAYQRLVDRLLASPRFGERWGRHWLDVVRFAESITLRGFLFPEAWRYRDYVIETFNADRPFDRFVREQIAGDLLTDSTVEQRRRNLVATTFLTMGNNNLEDQDKGKLRMDVVDEQLETIIRGFLAQTIGCARCHDHKFDPIPTRDYYALAGILRSTKTLNHANVSKWIEMPLPLTPDLEVSFKEHETAVASLQAQVKSLKPASGKLAPLPLKKVAGLAIDDLQAKLTGSWMRSTYSKSYVGTGYQHDQGATKGSNTATFRPEQPLDGEYEVRFAYTPGSNRSPAVPVRVIVGNTEKTTTINQKQRPAIDGRFVTLGRFRITPDSRPSVFVSNRNTTGVVIIDAVQFLPVTLADKQPVAGPSTSPKSPRKLQQLQKELAALKKRALPRPRHMGVQEEKTIENARIHIRGNVHSLGDAVPRGFLQVAEFGPRSTFSNQQSGRRELGEWIANERNPLTARVLANRLWHWLFGTGLVRTTDNFGTTGERPSHPELLDHLALRLIERNWSIKSLLREMVLTRTYRLSSRPDQRRATIDPENRLLWRMNRRRLDAESLLDAILMINGRLRTEIGGSTIRAGTPNDYNYRHDGDRRAVYWPVLRNSLPEIFEVFDFANPSMVVGRRDSSSSAPQALLMMNNPWVIQQSEHAADSLLNQRQLDDRRRLEQLVRATLGRPPSPHERRVMLSFLGSGSRNEKTRRLRWTQVVQALFSSVDFRYLH
ncbi:MAG: hypothetical protein CMJ65_07000 [Planctomycetaceae bacterium]|nr:hypothetical protein [Planctomycetaceae bacterium]